MHYSASDQDSYASIQNAIFQDFRHLSHIMAPNKITQQGGHHRMLMQSLCAAADKLRPNICAKCVHGAFGLIFIK